MKHNITYCVIAYYNKGFKIKGTGLTLEDAYDLRETLVALDIYTKVSIGVVGAYFVHM